MKTKRVVIAWAMASLATATFAALLLSGRLGFVSTASAQSSASVTCYPSACYGDSSYANQCQKAKSSYEENKHQCEKLFYDMQSVMDKCIHGIDWTVNKPCTCASNCSKAVCTKWQVGDNSCVSAEFR